MDDKDSHTEIKRKMRGKQDGIILKVCRPDSRMGRGQYALLYFYSYFLADKIADYLWKDR